MEDFERPTPRIVDGACMEALTHARAEIARLTADNERLRTECERLFVTAENSTALALQAQNKYDDLRAALLAIKPVLDQALQDANGLSQVAGVLGPGRGQYRVLRLVNIVQAALGDEQTAKDGAQ